MPVRNWILDLYCRGVMCTLEMWKIWARGRQIGRNNGAKGIAGKTMSRYLN